MSGILSAGSCVLSNVSTCSIVTSEIIPFVVICQISVTD
jgi:hypothetical protein